MHKEEVYEKIDVKNDYPLESIYFYLTEGCNLACRHCWLSPKHQDEKKVYPTLSIELFKSILEQAAPLGLTAVKITGGEPLMHPEIHELLRIVKEGNIDLTVETNGVLCTSELAEEIALCKGSSVSVSLDGADAETHEWVRGISGCFEAAIEGIRNLVNAGIKPQIILTVMRHNKSQIEPLVHLAETLEAESVKFNLVQPTGRGEKLNDCGETLSLEELLELGQWINNTLSGSTKLRIHYDVPPAFRPMSSMFGKKGDGCSKCGILKIIGVLANGNYALCGIGEHIPELVFGHASKDRLDDVWKKNKVLCELRDGIPSRLEGICGRCHMKRMCSASCIAQNYYRSKNLWEPYWFCKDAYERGLFPKTRISPKIG